MYWLSSILFESNRVLTELETAREYNAALLSHHLRSARATAEPDALDEAQAARRTVRIFFKNLLLVPRIASFDDVLRLREDRRIDAFRKRIFAFAKLLQAGDVSSEDRLKKEIEESNEAVRSLGKYRRASTFMVGISVPVAVASFLAHAPLGLITAPIGVSLFTYQQLKTKKNEWILLGR
jgi:hypothetical protein